MPYSILVADDNTDTRENIRELLDENDYISFGAANGKEALKILDIEKPNGMILDMNMPLMNGWEVLEKIKPEIEHGLLVIIITAYGDVPLAVDAIKQGVYDFFDKPFNNDKLLLSIKNGLEKFKIQQELKELKAKSPSKLVTLEDFGPSPQINAVLDDVKKVAKTNYSVLIEGPTGSGKNLIARYLHQQSLRKDAPFVNVDCGTISSTLIESELFGHIKGSFTNAIDNKEGKFKSAHKGTLVLDEIGNIPLEQQVKFLRAVEEKKISPIGSNQEFDVDFRLIVATLENLEKLVAAGKFRRDLYYRIAEFSIKVPALADRQNDIIHLSKRFIKQCNLNLNKQISDELNAEVSDKLLAHQWPGNVRELQHVISAAVLMAKKQILPKDIIYRGLTTNNSDDITKVPIIYKKGSPLKDSMTIVIEKLERQYLEKALELAEYNKSKAAQIFGIDRKNFYSKLAKYSFKDSK